MITRKEQTSLVFEKQGGVEVPTIAIIRDPASSHSVLYRLEEMTGDQIEQAFKGATKEQEKSTP